MTVLRRLRARTLSLFVAACAISGLTGAAYARYEAMAVTGSISAKINLTETALTNLSSVTAKVNPVISLDQSFTSGTGLGQMDKKWCDRRTIAASGADTLDLAGVLTNEFGAVVTFARVRSLAVKADTGNTNNVWMGGAAANRFNAALKDSSVVVIEPSAMLLLGGRKAGYTVTAGTGDKLLFKNSAGGSTVTYEVCIGGTSA